MSKNKIKKVVIVGGTHGNEFTGAYLAKHWLKNPNLVKRDGFKTDVVFANEKAFKEVRRYIDKDLNRSCSQEIIKSANSSLHEEKLAKELNQKIGPKDDREKNADFVIDLHTTTANMGMSLVVSNNSELTWLAASYLSSQFPTLKIYRWQGDEEGAYVNSLGSDGFAIEIGAIPQGVLRADIYKQSEELVYKLLDFLSKLDEVSRTITLYDHVKLVDFPRDEEGEITAMVHQNRQDSDFELIHKSEPMFITFNGETIVYEDDEPLYGVFINEAAYYEKGFAMCLARKIEYSF